MQRRREVEERSETAMEYTDVETAAETLDKSMIFHVVKEIVGFVLFMHQQIPAILQDLTLEFDSIWSERKDLELVLAENNVKACSRRKHIGRMREVKQGIKRLEKLVKSVSSFQAAFQAMLNEIHQIEGVFLVLGSSPIRPLHVYEIFFSHGRLVVGSTNEYSKSKAAETLSRKAIRALISNGAGSVSYSGPTKLFLLVKAPAAFSMPLHFLPKREFRYNKKIVPLRLHIKCKVRKQDIDASGHGSPSSTTISSSAASPNELICEEKRKGGGMRMRREMKETES